MTGPTGPEYVSPHLREVHASSTESTAVDLTLELTPDEAGRVHELMGRHRSILLVDFRAACRWRGVSSLGRVFSQWEPRELAKAIVLLERTPTKPLCHHEISQRETAPGVWQHKVCNRISGHPGPHRTGGDVGPMSEGDRKRKGYK